MVAWLLLSVRPLFLSQRQCLIYEIVFKSYEDIKSKKHIDVDKFLEFDFETNKKTDRLIEIVKKINEINENTIVYCSTRNYTETYAG